MQFLSSMVQAVLMLGLTCAAAFGVFHGTVKAWRYASHRRNRHFNRVHVRGYGSVDVGVEHVVRWLTLRGIEVLEHSSCGPTGKSVRVCGHFRRPPSRGFVLMSGPRDLLAGLIEELTYLAVFSDEVLASNLRSTQVIDDGPGWNDDGCPTFSAVYLSSQERRSGRRVYKLELRFSASDLQRLNTMLRREIHQRASAATSVR